MTAAHARRRTIDEDRDPVLTDEYAADAKKKRSKRIAAKKTKKPPRPKKKPVAVGLAFTVDEAAKIGAAVKPIRNNLLLRRLCGLMQELQSTFNLGDHDVEIILAGVARELRERR